jgi:hypothetical protein
MNGARPDLRWLPALTACVAFCLPASVLGDLLTSSTRGLGSRQIVMAVLLAAGVAAVWRLHVPVVTTLAAWIAANTAAMCFLGLYFDRRGNRLADIVLVIASLTALHFVCRRIASASGIEHRGLRFVWLLAALPVPYALIQWFSPQRGPGWFRFVAAAVLLVGAAVSLIGTQWSRPISGWRWTAAGLSLSLTLPAAADYYRNRAVERERAEQRAALASIPPVSPNADYPMYFFQRGVCFTAEFPARYGSPASRQMLQQLPAWGIDSIALVPFFWVRHNPLRLGPSGPGSWEPEDGIQLLAAIAHQSNMRVLLKPHGWRQPGKERDTPEFRRLWFEAYGNLAEHYARFAVKIHADLFAIGTELGWLAGYDEEWRKIVTRVRAIYPGPLTYAATQGPEFETIRFWDVLDYIGLDNYYPLSDDYSTAHMLQRIETVQQRFRKPVLFTEAGFSAMENAHRAPWEDETGKPLSLEEQKRCYQALLATFYQKPWFAGVYWWKVGTNGYGGPGDNTMTPWRKPAMDVVKQFYTGTGRTGIDLATPPAPR